MDINNLNKFYKSSIGKCTRQLLGHSIGKLTGVTKDLNILGVGYANPYLREFFDKSDTIISVVISSLGIVRWPRAEPNRSVSADEDYFPLQNNSIDIVIMVHALEFADSAWAMMTEVNRVLPVCGRVIVVVPNRVGVWSKRASLPFGNGKPYTKGQLKKIMRSTGFTPISHTYSLFFLPFKLFSHSKITTFCERWLHFLYNENSGVIVGLYEKKIASTIKTGVKLKKINPILSGVTISPKVKKG